MHTATYLNVSLQAGAWEVLSLGSDSSHLHQKGDDIARNGYLGRPSAELDQVAYPINELHGSSKDGIDRCSEKRGSTVDRMIRTVYRSKAHMAPAEMSGNASNHLSFADYQGYTTTGLSSPGSFLILPIPTMQDIKSSLAQATRDVPKPPD